MLYVAFLIVCGFNVLATAFCLGALLGRRSLRREIANGLGVMLYDPSDIIDFDDMPAPLPKSKSDHGRIPL